MTLFRNRIAFLMALSRIRNIVVYGVPPLTLNNAVAGSLGSLIAYGGTYQGVPDGYTPYNYISNSSALIDTGIYDDVDDVVYEILVEAQSTTAFYIFGSRETTSSVQYGISGSGSANNKTITFLNNTLTSSIRREFGNTYYIKASHINGVCSLYVKDITNNVDDTKTGTYTWGIPAPTPINLFGNGVQPVGTHYIKYARLWKSGKLVMDYVPATYNGTPGFYDRISNTFKTQSTGSLSAGAVQYPAPTAPADIVCNNGVVKVSPNLFNKNNLPERIHAYFSSSGTTWTYTGTGYSLRFPCSPNTTYTARYNGNSTQAVLSFASTNNDDVPTSNQQTVTVTQAIRQNSPTINTPITLTTGANDKWLIVQYNATEPQNTDMADNLQIERGSTATPYMPYGYYADGNTETLSIWQVPAGYKQLEYIYNDATALPYIETSWKPNLANDVRIIGKATYMGSDTSYRPMLFGNYTASSPSTSALSIEFDGRTANNLRIYTLKANASTGGDLQVGPFSTDDVVDFDIQITGSTGALSVSATNGTVTRTGTGTIQNVGEQTLYNMRLFRDYRSNTSTIQKPSKIYKMKVFENNVLVLDLLPAKRNSDGEIGMYDTVSGTFFTNQGTGTFTAGPLANTVVCEPLFGGEPYGTDPEEQNILTGEVTRWYKVMVLDGSENWSGDASDNPKDDGWILNVSDYSVPASRDVRFWCTHFFHIAIFPASNPEGRCCGYTTNQLWFGAAQMCPTLASWKAWLKQQSETRNPVIIVYHSANSSTEQVAAQSVNVEAGSNTLDFVETAITDLKLKATYTRVPDILSLYIVLLSIPKRSLG